MPFFLPTPSVSSVSLALPSCSLLSSCSLFLSYVLSPVFFSSQICLFLPCETKLCLLIFCGDHPARHFCRLDKNGAPLTYGRLVRLLYIPLFRHWYPPLACYQRLGLFGLPPRALLWSRQEGSTFNFRPSGTTALYPCFYVLASPFWSATNI